jgi:hypothetical protein
MAGQTIIIGNWNDTTPAAPVGHDNVKFQKDAATPPNISAYIPKAQSVAVFLLGLGAAISAGNNVAPVYRVKKAGTISKFAAIAKAALDEDAVFMIVRVRSGSSVNILTANLTISASSTAWAETTAFDNADLAVGDELRVNVVSGYPENVTLELYWN